MTRRAGPLARLVGHARAVAEIRALPASARVRLFFGFLDALPRRDFELRVRGGRLVFPVASRHEDRWTFYEIWRFREYGDDFRNATVLDLGAHKGYFGAYAFACGANEVVSFEPEPVNFAALERAAETSGDPWTVKRLAVGAGRPATAALRLAPISSAHTLLPADTQTVGEETVEVTPAAEWIEYAAHRASRLIVKIDIEGMECDVVLGTPIEVWRQIDEIYVELHETAPCAPERLLAHLAAAGLELVRIGETTPRVAYLRRLLVPRA